MGKSSTKKGMRITTAFVDRMERATRELEKAGDSATLAFTKSGTAKHRALWNEYHEIVSDFTGLSKEAVAKMDHFLIHPASKRNAKLHLALVRSGLTGNPWDRRILNDFNVRGSEG